LLTADTVQIGDANANATITTNGTGDLILNTNAGTNSGSITIADGVNGNITIATNGTGVVIVDSEGIMVGSGTSPAGIVTPDNTSNLILATNNGTATASIEIIAGTNGDIEITPNGTGKTLITNLVSTETIVANGNTGAATLTPNAALGAVQSYTVTGNITFSAFGTPLAGQSLTLILTQDGTGSRLLTSTMKFAGGSKTLSTAANAVDIITVYYDGTNYWASLSKGFA
jgi:hypothetical protein